MKEQTIEKLKNNFGLKKDFIETLQKSEVFNFIINIPKIVGAEQHISNRLSVLYVIDILHNAFDACPECYSDARIEWAFSFPCENPKKLEACKDILKAIMWNNYRADRERDKRKNKFNPVNEYPELSIGLLNNSIDKSLKAYENYPELEQYIGKDTVTAGWWMG